MSSVSSYQGVGWDGKLTYSNVLLVLSNGFAQSLALSLVEGHGVVDEGVVCLDTAQSKLYFRRDLISVSSSADKGRHLKLPEIKVVRLTPWNAWQRTN